MSPNGTIASLWLEEGGVAASIRPPGGSFSGRIVVASLPGNSLYSPGVAVNDAGETVVVWQNLTAKQYEAAIRPPGGSFSAPVVLTGPTTGISFFTSVAIDDAGDVIVGTLTYNGSNLIASYAWRPAGGSFSLFPLSEQFTTTALTPSVAIDSAGDAIAAWVDKTSTGKFLAKAIRRSAGGSFGAPQTLSDSAGESTEPAAAMGPAGQSAVAWSHVDSEAHRRIQVSTSISASGLLSTAQTLSRAGSSGEYPAVAVSASGQAVAVWNEVGTGEIAGGPVGGSFGPVTDLSIGGEPEVAVDDAGDAIATWGHPEASNYRVEVATRSAAGAVSTPVSVSTPGDTFTVFGNVPFAFVGMNHSGDAVVGWTRNNDSSAQANIFDATPPNVTLSAPAGATAGQPVGLSAASSDLFSDIASVKWSFGDGGAGEGSALTHTYSNPGVYTVTATSSDAVGNVASASGQITVTAPQTPPVLSLNRSPIVKCLVPRTTGLTSASAKRRLLAAHCALGKVSIAKRYRHAKRLVVSAQSVKAGTSVTSGTKVSLTLKPPPPPRHKKSHR
jgi:hypothetical protein